MKSLFLWILVIILIITTFFFATKAHSLSKKLSDSQVKVVKVQNNQHAVDFLELFVDKVLKANGEVDFDTRVKLDESIRAMNDEEILAQWQKFSLSPTEAEAQAEVKELLSLIVKKIRETN